MNATARTVLVLAALAGGVFGLTVIKQYTRKAPATGGGPGKDPTSADETVRYNLTQMRLDPASPYPAHHEFPGYFEVGTEFHVVFWVNNPNPFPVSVGTRGRSCTSCTEAALAVVDDSHHGVLPPTGALFGGAAYADPDVFNTEAWARVAATQPPDRWQKLNFDKPEARVPIPAAPADSPPVWAAVRVKVVAKPGPHAAGKGITAGLAFHAEGRDAQVTTFLVEYVGVPPFDLMPHEMKFGELAEADDAKTLDAILFSSTRTELPPPLLAADARNPFLTFGKAEPLTPDELRRFVADQGGAKANVKVMVAYRVPVTLTRKAGGRELDIGPLEASFTGTADGTNYSTQVQVRATVQGAVALRDGAAAVNLGSFNGRTGTTKEAWLVGSRPDLELEPVPGEHKPDYLRVTLAEPETSGDRRYWKATVTVGPNDGLGPLPAGSAAVFRVRGTGQIVRIPVKGQGTLTSGR